MSGNIVGLRPIFLKLDFWFEKAMSQKRNYVLARNMRTTHFHENVLGKMFLECYKDQNEWQHHGATANISQPSFLAEKAESQKRKYISGRKMRKTHFHEKCFK